jgi:hypothetical protein
VPDAYLPPVGRIAATPVRVRHHRHDHRCEENDRLQLGWNLQRTLAKINYRIHTDGIKEALVPPTVTEIGQRA